MNTIDLIYKGKTYTVYNPGEIMRVGRSVIDQLLDGVTVMKRTKPGGVAPYILEKYNLTIQEYYLIVVFSGDESRIPICPGCGERTPWLGILSGYKLTCGKKECHYKSMVLTMSKPGGAYERNHELRSELSRKICKNQIANGTHNFQNEDGSWKSKEVQLNLVKEGKHHWQKENGYSEKSRLRNLDWSSKGINPFQSNFPTLKADRNYFLQNGNLDDICVFYEAKWINDNDNFKIGITSSFDRRSTWGGISHFSEIHEIYSSTRSEIAELEYQVKLKFYGKATKGTETFPLELREEILEFAKTLYNK